MSELSEDLLARIGELESELVDATADRDTCKRNAESFARTIGELRAEIDSLKRGYPTVDWKLIAEGQGKTIEKYVAENASMRKSMAGLMEGSFRFLLNDLAAARDDAIKERDSLRAEVVRLTKRCEGVRAIMEMRHSGDLSNWFYLPVRIAALWDEWQDGKP